jgi:TonB family protein
MRLFWGLICLLSIPFASYSQQNTSPHIHDYVYVDLEPKPLNLGEIRREIGYPLEALKSGWEGTVLCRILIDEEGHYLQHHISRTPHVVFQEAVEAHLSKVRFSPALANRKPVQYWVNLPISFYQQEADKLLLYQRTNNFGILSLLKRSKRKTQLYQHYAQEAMQQGRFIEAVSYYSRSLSHQASSKRPSSEKMGVRFQTFSGRAKALILAGDFAEALPDLSEAIGLTLDTKVFPDSLLPCLPDLYFQRAQVFLALKQPARAKAEAVFLRLYFPQNPQALDLADVLEIAACRQLQQYEQAFAIVEKLLERNPVHPEGHFQKGLVLASIGAPAEARRHLEQAIDLGLNYREKGIAMQLLSVASMD